MPPYSKINTLESILSQLNGFLTDDQLNKLKFDRVLKRLKKLCNLQIGLIDFKYFDEKRLKKAHKEKQKAIQTQNFEYTCNQLYLESVCEKYIELRTLINQKESFFLFEKNFLIYCHYGTSKNDSQLMQFIIHDEKYIKLNIKI